MDNRRAQLVVSVPWWFLRMSGDKDNALTGWVGKRLDQLEGVLSEREWLAAGRFTVADLLMADVLRISDVRSFGNRPCLIQEGSRRPDRSFQGGRPTRAQK